MAGPGPRGHPLVITSPKFREDLESRSSAKSRGFRVQPRAQGDTRRIGGGLAERTSRACLTQSRVEKYKSRGGWVEEWRPGR